MTYPCGKVSVFHIVTEAAKVKFAAAQGVRFELI